jgi:hypothetical protein
MTNRTAPFFLTITNDQTINGYQAICRYLQKTRSYRPYSNHILICMLVTAAAAWEGLQAKSCAGIMNNINLVLLHTFSPSPMNNQSMVIS